MSYVTLQYVLTPIFIFISILVCLWFRFITLDNLSLGYWIKKIRIKRIMKKNKFGILYGDNFIEKAKE